MRWMIAGESASPLMINTSRILLPRAWLITSSKKASDFD
jgi:hypothetical protein